MLQEVGAGCGGGNGDSLPGVESYVLYCVLEVANFSQDNEMKDTL